MYKKYTVIICSVFILIGCAQKDEILSDYNFNDGDWILVHKSHVSNSIEIINDEKTLKDNKHGIALLPGADCEWTTCDGAISLYKDGKLIKKTNYLSRENIYESNHIKNSYIKGIRYNIDPINKLDFNTKWDSILQQSDYPTIYKSQPDNKNIILAYKLEKTKS